MGFTHAHHRDSHMGIHTGDQPYRCELCWKAEADHLKRHSRIQTSEGPYKCKVCQKAFSNGSSPRRQTHKGDTPGKLWEVIHSNL